MREKTLLYGALGATAIAAMVGVWHAHSSGKGSVEIVPVSLSDSNRSTVPTSEIPIKLTASDGTGIKLVAMRVASAVDDPLALTELHLTFENPDDRVLEGTFSITLPQGASLSRFAMRVDGRFQEGEVVEKQAARQAYEDFLHRRQDPALMEQAGGNEFTARVFPIPAKGKKELVVSYSEVLEAGSPYVLPLRGLPTLGALDIDVQAHGKNDARFELHQSQITPASDFVVEAKHIPRSAGLRNGDLAMMRVVPFTSSRPEAVNGAVVLVDTSASRGLGLAEQARLVHRVMQKLPADTKVVVGCFDQEVAPIYEGRADGFGDAQVTAIVARGALGASDFESALAWAGEKAKAQKAKRVVFVGDGVATAGETDSTKLKTKVEALRAAGVERVDAIAVGGIRDDAFMRGLVRGVLDRDGIVLDAKLGPEAIARRLQESTSSGIPVKVDGATWSWPKTLDGMQAGDEVVVFAQLDANTPMRVEVGTQEIRTDLRTVDRPLLERAWAEAKIASLLAAPTEDPVTTKKQIVALSTRHRVLSPHTAMLVLESDSDYQRFGIDRTANADILIVKEGAIAVDHSSRNAKDEEEAQDKEKADVPRTQTASTGGKNKGAQGATGGDSLAHAIDDNAPGTTPPVFQPPAEAPAPAADSLAEAAGRPRAVAPPQARPSMPAGRLDEGAAAVEQKPAKKYKAPESGGGENDQETRRALETLQKAQRETSLDGNDGDPSSTTTTKRTAPPPPPPAPTATATAAVPATPPAMRPRAPRPSGNSDGPGDLGGTRGHGAGGGGSGSGFGTGSGIVGGNGRGGPTGGQQRDGWQRPPTQPASGTINQGALVAQGPLSQEEAMRVVRQAMPQMRACYTNRLRGNPTERGEVSVDITIDAVGTVKKASVTRSSGDAGLDECALSALRAQTYPAPATQDARFFTSFTFVPNQGGSEAVANGAAPQAAPYEGRFKIIMDSVARHEIEDAVNEARKWHDEQPGDVMALVALGETMEAKGDLATAARAYGSILELFSSRADSRRFAGERLERLNTQAALRLAADSYAKAVVERPDHPASHRLYAYTLLKLGEHEKAFEALKAGATRTYPSGRFLGVDRILKEDLGLVAAAWTHAQPQRAKEIASRLSAAGGIEENGSSLRFVLVWETDANDVDFHIYDALGGHAYYGHKDLPSGGSLYADVTTGYGPECFTIRGSERERQYPYTLQAHYYSRGPMGYGMGKLEIIEHDGHGNLSFKERPFVVMADRAFVDLGTVTREKAAATALLK